MPWEDSQKASLGKTQVHDHNSTLGGFPNRTGVLYSLWTQVFLLSWNRRSFFHTGCLKEMLSTHILILFSSPRLKILIAHKVQQFPNTRYIFQESNICQYRPIRGVYHSRQSSLSNNVLRYYTRYVYFNVPLPVNNPLTASATMAYNIEDFIMEDKMCDNNNLEYNHPEDHNENQILLDGSFFDQ